MAVFEEARRLLVRQEQDLDTLRARAITLLSASAVVAGLVINRLHEHRSGFATAMLIVGFTLFAITIAAVIFIVWPRTLVFSHGLDDWVDDLRHDRHPTVNEWAFNLSRDFETFRHDNQRSIRKLYDALAAVCVLLGVQVLAWLLAVV